MVIVEGAPDRAGEAAALLARAFDEDSGARLLYPGAERGPILQRRFLRLLGQGKCEWFAGSTPAGQLEACAVWSKPFATAVPTRPRRAWSAPDLPPPRAVLRMALATPALIRLAARSRPGQAWTLVALGVEPELRGEGRGSAILRRLLQELEAARAPCYLETVDARNLPFYERHGFRIAGTAEPLGGVRTHAMVRRPAPAADEGVTGAARRIFTS
jgi:ribosomal protein S18 acetylase RimI-like enzyme